MKKFKKVFAVLLTLAMVLGMSMTTFAGEVSKSATITVNKAGDAASFSYLPIIVPNQQEKTGWAFANNNIAANYKTAFPEKTEQEIIQLMIDYKKNPNANSVKGVDSQIANALANIKAANYQLITEGVNKNVINVSEAGVYYIEGSEANFSYNPMAAYVSFDEYNAETGLPSTLESTTVDAKRRSTFVEKEVSDKVTEKEQDVTFTISSVVPTYLANATPTFIITDEISGAEFVRSSNDTTKVPVRIYYNIDKEAITGETPYIEDEATIDPKNSKKFILNLSTQVASHAEESIVVTYEATVKETTVNNSVSLDNGGNNPVTDNSQVYTAQIELTKTGEGSAPLENAKFVIYKTENGTTKYASFNENMELTGWVDDYKSGNDFVENTIITTNENGKAKVYGFDPAVTYTFKEVEAPEGYSLADDKALDWTSSQVSEDDVNESNPMEGKISVSDTKLSGLPSTGGIGTTIFTIGGCAIMIIAAALFFASRRKSAK